ncbi:SPOR domain-containing protein [Thalassotalea castellviae]|uniref:SPOR domain-containing protein n=1 Tax=Thalassotalea castellviae TaxID=3075612 RepID=A0ABU3A244_9GAMM|nr:SPOR domain-containing protein [Thalassotalea sp. W431]MDT0604255.1 SPOR domain-containing protein [Thalassotalea sp. W431]
MNKLTIIFIVFVLLPFSILAQDKHKVGAGVNYHLDQENGPGYHIFYQWQFGESFEFETRYFDNNDIMLENNDTNIFANYSQFSLGANFIKRYNSDLSIKAGTGLGFVINSSNEAVIEKQMSPYIMLAATYQLTKNLALEFGQFSHFNSEIIDTNHSLFLSLSYQFGQKYSNYSPEVRTASPAVRTTTTTETPNQVRPSVPAAVVEKTPQMKRQAIKSNVNKPQWYVQFGAFSNISNAQQSLTQLQQLYPNIHFQLVNANHYFRIISHAFETKQRADDFISMLKTDHNLSGYITQLSLANN